MSSNRVAAVVLVGLVGLGVALFAWRKSDTTPSKRVDGAKLVLPPLTAASEIIALAVPGTDGVRVSVPLGAVEPRPIVVVLHGEAERADQHCKIWRGITRAHPFVLCPQLGALQTQQEVEEALRGALRELKSAFADHVAPGPIVLAGFGSGADHAMRVARHEPSFFARLVLVDGGYENFGATAAGAFKQRGGQRMLFACSSDSCQRALEPKIAVIRTQDLPVELLHAGELPGALDARMVALLSERFPWVSANDPPPRRVPNPRGMVAE